MIKAETAQAKVDRYVESVTSGEVVVGTLVRDSVLRYLSDLERGEEWPYYFDCKAATKACDFFPTMLRHSTGGTAGLPFQLTGFQQFIVWNLFGWKRKEDDTRRFRKAFVSMARKNGKSTLAAGIAIYMAGTDINPRAKKPEPRSEVLLAATQREQAMIIYNEVLRMLDASPKLMINTQEKKGNQARIEFKQNDGQIRSVGSDRAKDGFNPHLVVLDEVHAFTKSHQATYNTLQTGSGFRDQPLILTVTTAGDNHSFIWADEWKWAKGVVEGTFEDDSLFAMCFEIDEKDDPLDPEVWIKANPNLGECLREEYLVNQAKQAKESALKLNVFTRYHANRQVKSTESAFDMDAWDECKGELSDWSKADCIGAGIDLGSRDDLAASALVARFVMEDSPASAPVYRYEITCRSYIADDTVRDLTAEPFVGFVKSGELRKCPHPLAELQAELLEQCRQTNVDSVAYDPYNAQPMAEALELAGLTVASMAQNTSHFNEPIQEIKQAIKDGRVTHDGNPVLRWAFDNAVAKVDWSNRWMLTKRDSKDKIDPCVAVLMAFRRSALGTPRAKGPLYCV
jgi:phage terminase large subunit-like protein